jgi:hypothetical protein
MNIALRLAFASLFSFSSLLVENMMARLACDLKKG